MIAFGCKYFIVDTIVPLQCGSVGQVLNSLLGITSNHRFRVAKGYFSVTGNRTLVSRVTGGDTSHYTMTDVVILCGRIKTHCHHKSPSVTHRTQENDTNDIITTHTYCNTQHPITSTNHNATFKIVHAKSYASNLYKNQWSCRIMDNKVSTIKQQCISSVLFFYLLVINNTYICISSTVHCVDSSELSCSPLKEWFNITVNNALLALLQSCFLSYYLFAHYFGLGNHLPSLLPPQPKQELLTPWLLLQLLPKEGSPLNCMIRHGFLVGFLGCECKILT